MFAIRKPAVMSKPKRRRLEEFAEKENPTEAEIREIRKICDETDMQ